MRILQLDVHERTVQSLAHTISPTADRKLAKKSDRSIRFVGGRGGFDLIAQGMGDIMHMTGEPDGPPTSVRLPICDLGTGMWAVQGILAALYERQDRPPPARRVLADRDRYRLQPVDLGPMAHRQRGAGPPRLAPSFRTRLTSGFGQSAVI